MSQHTDNKPWHRQFWPWFLVALPAIVVIACLYTVYLALHNPLSIVKDDYYKEGLAINQDKQRYVRAVELQLAAHCLLVNQQIQCGFISGANAVGEKPLQLQLMHPVNSDKDVILRLLPVTSGLYRSEILSPALLETFRQENRWYIYLEVAGGDWALQTESPVHDQSVIELGGVGG